MATYEIASAGNPAPVSLPESSGWFMVIVFSFQIQRMTARAELRENAGVSLKLLYSFVN
jgi:hypothetical protein